MGLWFAGCSSLIIVLFNSFGVEATVDMIMLDVFSISAFTRLVSGALTSSASLLLCPSRPR